MKFESKEIEDLCFSIVSTAKLGFFANSAEIAYDLSLNNKLDDLKLLKQKILELELNSARMLVIQALK